MNNNNYVSLLSAKIRKSYNEYYTLIDLQSTVCALSDRGDLTLDEKYYLDDLLEDHLKRFK